MADYLLLCITNLYLLDELLYLFFGGFFGVVIMKFILPPLEFLCLLLGVVSSSDLPVVLSGDSK